MKTKTSYYFPCSDWLSLYHKGETLLRKLTPTEKEEVYRGESVLGFAMLQKGVHSEE